MCRTSYLAIAFARDDPEDGTNKSAFIVQSDSDTSPLICQHETDLHAGRRSSSWRALALLAGYRQGTSSLGTIISVSSCGMHIAAATWNRYAIPSLLYPLESFVIT